MSTMMDEPRFEMRRLRDVAVLPSLNLTARHLSVFLFAALVTAGTAGYWLDVPAARFATTLSRGQVQVLNTITNFGTSGYMFTLSAAVAVASLIWRRRTTNAALRALLARVAARSAFFFACIALSGLLAQTIKHTVGRMRPRYLAIDGAFDFVGLSWAKGADSFPSGHTTSAFAAAAAIGLFLPRLRVPLVGIAVLIGLSRIATGNHYPSDVIFGAALGSVVTIGLCVWIARAGPWST